MLHHWQTNNEAGWAAPVLERVPRVNLVNNDGADTPSVFWLGRSAQIAGATVNADGVLGSPHAAAADAGNDAAGWRPQPMSYCFPLPRPPPFPLSPFAPLPFTLSPFFTPFDPVLPALLPLDPGPACCFAIKKSRAG